MNYLLSFNQLLEKLQMATANWSIVSNESSFEKKENNGYLVFSKAGTFSIIYIKGDEESRLEFYNDKQYSSDKKSVCECKIITTSGTDRVKKGFSDITPENVWDIVSTFFDYSNLEKMEKNDVDRFIMGFSKSIKEVKESEEKDQLPPSFNIFHKYLMSAINKSGDIPKIENENYDFRDIISKFISHLKNNKKF
jgi:hypothetical protein